LNEIAARGARVVSIMPETEEFIGKAAAKTRNAVTFLSDIDCGYALNLGLVIWLGERVRDLYLSHGLNLEMYQGSNSWFVPIPATFVVGKDGRILARHVDPDFRHRMDVEDIIATLEAAR
jgi:peroxiredoxin